MKRFMAMLNRSRDKDPPPAKLLDLAGQLCQDLQSSPPSLEKLVGAVMGCEHKMYFLTNIHVVRACVSFHIHNGQHDAACRLLEVGMCSLFLHGNKSSMRKIVIIAASADPNCSTWSVSNWCMAVEGDVCPG